MKQFKVTASRGHEVRSSYEVHFLPERQAAESVQSRVARRKGELRDFCFLTVGEIQNYCTLLNVFNKL